MASATPPEDHLSAPPDSGAETRQHGESAQGEALFRVNPALAPGLYVVSTPIGNLRDITLRALDVLSSVDLVCAEDTRVSGKLLSAFGVSARLRPYHDHNAAEARPGLLQQMKKGGRIALISDAGTPLVSDPGYKLVREAAEQGISVFTVPGASAPMAALSISGLPTDRFTFAGFPPPKSGARKRFFGELKRSPGTLAFFEGPSRLAASLADMAEVFGARDSAVARELTKKFEEVRRGKLGELASAYASEHAPRGELVVLVGPEDAAEPAGEAAIDAAIAEADLTRPAKEVAAEIAERLGVKRRDVYERILDLKEADEDSEA